MREQIFNILNELNDDFKQYQGDDMIRDHILDSFTIMELVASIEDFNSIEIDAEDIVVDNFKTVDTILKLVEKYIKDRV